MRVNVVNRKSEGFNNAGSVLTGPLVLSGNPTQPMEAATKQYLDLASNAINASNITTGVLSVSRLPAFDGDFTSLPGSNALVLKDVEEFTPGTYTKVTVDAKGRVIAGGSLTNADIPDISWAKVTVNKPSTLAGYGITDGVSTNGDAVTGHITLHADPTSGLQLATKQYVDQTATTAGAIKVGDTIRRTSSVTPTGYLRCNGGMANKTTYAALYAVIGDTFSYTTVPGSGQPWRQQYQINSEPSADITGWTTGTSLPGVLTYSQAIVTKNRVYLLGGVNNGGITSTVYTAPINSDGTLGTWTTGTSLPEPLTYSQAIVTKNRVYLLGGYNSGGYTSTVYTAPINSDGTLGTWSTGTPLPGPLGHSQAIVTKNRVYLLGGHNGSSYTSTVYTAPINSDGTLGTWTTGTSLPVKLAYSQAIVTKNRVYLLGGSIDDTTGHTSIVYTAPINSDDTLGTWSTGTPLPGPLGYSQVIITKNRVYLLGGVNNGGITSIVYTAPINSDGTLGTWTTGTPLPGPLGHSQAIVTKNRVYLLGGNIDDTTGHTATVYTAPFSGGLNDYSPYYDGSIVLNTDTTFALPDTTTTDPVGIYTYIKY